MCGGSPLGPSKPGDRRNVSRFSATVARFCGESQARLTGIGQWPARTAALAGGQQPSRALLQLANEVQRSQWTPVMGGLADLLGFLLRPAGTCQELAPLLRAPAVAPHLQVYQTVRGPFVAMHSGARPEVGFRLVRHLRPDRIALNVPEGRPEVVLIHGTRVVAALPDVPASRFAGIEIRRIPPMGTPQDPRHGVEPARKRDQMDVVAHQAVPQDVEPVEARELLKQTEVDEAIAVRFEDRPPGVPPLGDVIRRIYGQHASQTWHTVCSAAPALDSQEKPGNVPSVTGFWACTISLTSAPTSIGSRNGSLRAATFPASIASVSSTNSGGRPSRKPNNAGRRRIESAWRSVITRVIAYGTRRAV